MPSSPHVAVERREIMVNGSTLSCLHAPRSRNVDDAERSAWLAPWRDQQRVRSWTAMAGAAEMPDVTLTRLPGARHIPTVDEPALVVAALTDFLADSSSDRPRP